MLGQMPITVVNTGLPPRSLPLLPEPMPPVSPSACAPGQTYIPPGGMFTAGVQAGQITPTGACQDPTVTATTLPGMYVTDTRPAIGCNPGYTAAQCQAALNLLSGQTTQSQSLTQFIPTWVWVVAGGLMLLLVLKK